MVISEFIIWVLATLGIITLIAILAEKFGVEIAIGIYAALTVIANIIAVKVIAVGEVPLIGLIVGPAGVIVYASTFLVTDILTELYGKEYGKKAVITGFAANIVAIISILIALKWTPAPFVSAEFEQSFESVLGLAPRIVIASIIAYVISQTHDVYAFHFWKQKTRGRFLWFRNNASTMVSQLIDTVIFITIAFYGIFGTDQILSLIVGQYILKLIIAAVDTPFMYLAVGVWRVLGKEKVAVKAV
ncbi:MAG: queuosine precursor transporter [Archaeoglobus sp.]|nr:queuosine precursor transporter [Archaeoglobus sp.]